MILMVWLASNPLISSKSWVKLSLFLTASQIHEMRHTACCSKAVVALEALRE